MNDERRPSIPAAVARKLRQESGFGCCKCGHPIFQYHHIIPWSSEKHFRPADMMALCPNHHEMMRVTPIDEQYRIKALPYNIVNGFAKGLIINRSKELNVVFGGATFSGVNVPLEIAGREFIRLVLSHETILITIKALDLNGNIILDIENNEWKSATGVWDIKFSHNYLEVISVEKDSRFRIDAKKDPIRISGRFNFPGMRVTADANSLVQDFGSSQLSLSGVSFKGWDKAIEVSD